MRALACMLILLALGSCRTIQVENKPFTWTAPDSLDIDPTHLTPVNGWEPYLVNSKTVAWFPPPVNNQQIKVKRSGNTDNSQKKSGNTETTVKDSGNTAVKDKSKVKESGNTDSNNTAKQAGVIGDNSRADQKKGIPPALLYIVLVLVVLGAVYALIRKFFRLPRGGS